MKITLILSFISVLFHSCTAQYTLDEVTDITQEIVYRKSDMSPLSGEIKCQWGAIGNYKNGMKDGLHTEWYDNPEVYLQKIINNPDSLNFWEVFSNTEAVFPEKPSFMIFEQLDSLISQDFDHKAWDSPLYETQKMYFDEEGNEVKNPKRKKGITEEDIKIPIQEIAERRYPLAFLTDFYGSGSGYFQNTSHVFRINEEDFNATTKILNSADANGIRFLDEILDNKAKLMWDKTQRNYGSWETYYFFYLLRFSQNGLPYLSGHNISAASLDIGIDGNPVAVITFDTLGSELLETMTQEACNNNTLPYKAIAISFENEIIMAPSVMHPISNGALQIVAPRVDKKQMKSQGNYRVGKKQGIWKEWSSNGELISEKMYQNGVFVE